MVAIIFCWTPPHFWALSLTTGDDYERAGVPMLPVAKGEAATRLQILIYSLILVPLALAPAFTRLGGVAYLVIAALGGAAFVALAARLFLSKDRADAKRLFGFSIFYLFMLFAALLVEHLAGLEPLALRI
jgi:protoheme IX farnesyltransferase